MKRSFLLGGMRTHEADLTCLLETEANLMQGLQESRSLSAMSIT